MKTLTIMVVALTLSAVGWIANGAPTLDNPHPDCGG
jgi:hypothetical protein